MKRTAIVILLLFAGVIINATFTGFKERAAGIFAPEFTAVAKGSMEARINGNPIKLERYETVKSAEKVMEYYAKKAAARELINGTAVKKLAAILLGFAAEGTPDNWYYLLYKEGGGIRLITAGNYGDNCVFIKVNADEFSHGSGFNDGLRKYAGMDRFLSIELLSGGRTAQFANFYSTEAADVESLRLFYQDMLKKEGWKVSSAQQDAYFIEKQSKSWLLNIFDTEGQEKYVSVMGNAR